MQLVKDINKEIKAQEQQQQLVSERNDGILSTSPFFGHRHVTCQRNPSSSVKKTKIVVLKL